MLLETAINLGAQVRMGVEAVSIGDDGRTVTLRSGEQIRVDVVVGADGMQGISRETILGEQDVGKPTGLMMFK